MRYEDLYPDKWPGMYGKVFRLANPGPCWDCRDSTYFMDLILGVRVCSEECHQEAKNAKATADL